MDYTKIPRNLIYRDRKSLNEFIEGNNLNAIIVDNMQDVQVLMMGDFEARALTCMNGAYYICTLMLMEEHPEWRVPFFIDYPRSLEKYYPDKFQIVILSLVVIYLEHFDEQWQLKHERIIERIKTHIDNSTLNTGTIDIHGTQLRTEKLDYIFKSLVSGTNQDIVLPDNEFAPRNIGDEEISAVDIVEGSEYSIEAVKKIPTTSRKNKTINSILYRLDQIQNTKDSRFDNKKGEIKGVLERLIEGETETNYDDIEELKAEVEHLKNELVAYKKRNQNRSGLNRKLTAHLGMKLAPKLGIEYTNKKELAPMLSKLFGWGERALEQQMSTLLTDEEEMELANIFGKLSPELAREICKKWKGTPTQENEAPSAE